MRHSGNRFEILAWYSLYIRYRLFSFAEENENMNILEVKGLTKVYGKGEAQVRALDGIDLTIEKGEFAAIVGSSEAENLPF